jgi:hypothetical protein
MGRSLRQLSRLAANLDKPIPTPRQCQKGHDLTLPGARKLAHKGDGRYYWRCMVCRAERKAAERQLERERLAQERAMMKALGAALPAPTPTSDTSPKIDMSPFGITQRALVAYWQLEPGQWTLRHHVIHNRAMYHLLGWPKDGPVRSQPLHNIRVQGSRA